ncbi:MAG: sulfite exporter TauE/SafE family protein [Rhodocyclaceae bacterium]|nr:sulfite exporter TauE/SafE family protein [Rhodocyclaceae bacterium]
MPDFNLDTGSLLLAVMIVAAALLYSSVGHGGASGYLAAMALFGVAPAVMKPTALALNVLVSLIAFIRFYRVGAFSWQLFLPLIIASVPMAYLGGTLTLPAEYYRPVVGLVLLYAAWRFFATARSGDYPLASPSRAVLVGTGAALGLLSGLTGVGGGIFLSPLLLYLRWAPIKTISGISAAFILANSIAGLAGVLSKGATLPSALPLWAAAAVIGGLIGAEYGSRRLGNAMIQKLLAAVLVIAGLKMVLS